MFLLISGRQKNCLIILHFEENRYTSNVSGRLAFLLSVWNKVREHPFFQIGFSYGFE